MNVALNTQADPIPTIGPRIEQLDWARIAADLDAYGCAVTSMVLTPAECAALTEHYGSAEGQPGGDGGARLWAW